MFLLNTLADHNAPLDPADAADLGPQGCRDIADFLALCPAYKPTPLHALPALAQKLGIASIHAKDEGQRLGLSSFKSLGGAYAVMRLVLEEATRRLGRDVPMAALLNDEVKAIAATMTFGCATDGNHGRSVAAGARLVGAKSTIFVHEHVSTERVAAIARFGATMITVPGSYDDAVAEAARVCEAQGWITVSDTSWPGYERIPGLVMQGYTMIAHEALAVLPEPPTHIFIQAGVGGLAAAIAGHMALLLGERRPTFITVEPARAACIHGSAKAGKLVKIPDDAPTVMAMLECYEPSLTAWRVLSRVSDAFMTVDEDDAIATMRLLARPSGQDPAIVAGESGGAGLAGLIRAANDPDMRSRLGLNASSRILTVISEGATDPERYRELVG
ncbi:MAG: diaminopropionate ammonia-lyase [Bosea sp. (in: a-proteobacteria)]